jgi:hypothetical protein
VQILSINKVKKLTKINFVKNSQQKVRKIQQALQNFNSKIENQH